MGQSKDPLVPPGAIALPVRTVVATANDFDRLLRTDRVGPSFARKAFEILCKAGCNRLALTFILVHIEKQIPLALYPGWLNEDRKSRRQRLARESRVLDRAAAIIRSRHSFLVAESDAQNESLSRYDNDMAASGMVSPNRLVQALKLERDLPQQLADQWSAELELRPTQRPLEVISRYVMCAYVQRVTRKPRDKEVAVLLDLVGNYPGDAMRLAQWRHNNFARFDRHFSSSVQNLIEIFHRAPAPKI